MTTTLSAYNRRKRRPGFEAMLTAMKNGEFDALICWHTDRLYRRMGDLETLIEIADAAHVQIKHGAGRRTGPVHERGADGGAHPGQRVQTKNRNTKASGTAPPTRRRPQPGSGRPPTGASATRPRANRWSRKPPRFAPP